jgi:TonB-dependent receptor
MKHPQISSNRRQASRARLHPVAWASTLALMAGAGAVHAQQAAPEETKQLGTVVVTGIRKSLDSAVTLKRESRGMVDGIVAEDIGKFPDTNLAESMQRIAGVSIDRSASGEGSKVTVRGVGPDFNMVLLNGRQMPTAVIGWEGAGPNGSRAFDFANLSADSISALEVFKTARADSPTGGIGATINVKTARPLDVRERIASIGVKANYDASVGRLPDPLQGDKVTPEISGIYSDTFGNRTLGIAISGSYSKRDSGSNKAYTQNGWGTNDPAVKSVSPAGNIVNPPTGLYATSRDLRYSLTGMERERLNGQVTLQFAPSKDLKFTVDHTMAVNTLSSKNAEMSSWFNNSFSGPLGSNPPTKFTTGSVAAPIVQTAIWADGKHDLAINTGQYAQKSKLNSTGFNAEWKLSDALSVDIDAHHSKSKTSPDSPFGTYNALDLAMFNQGNATAYYDRDLPILSLPGQTFDGTKTNVTGTQFRNNLSDQTIDQAQARGTYRVDADNKLLVGLGFTKTKNRSASFNNQNNDWSGVAPSLGQFAGVKTSTYNLGSFFGRIPGHDDSRLFSSFYMADFDSLRAEAIKVKMANTPGMTQAQAEAYFAAAPDYTRGDDWRATEKSSSAYAQWDHAFNSAIPMNISVGVRYETTKVEASSQVVSRVGATNWKSQNEIDLSSSAPIFGTKTGKYTYWLPSIDWDADLADNLKVRASYGENIGRPGWNQMQGGQSLNNPANPNGGGTGSTGDPALKPLKSKNLDLSAEWYYAKSSYAALGLFYKKVNNFVTTSTFDTTIAGVLNPASGTYYNAALAACGGNTQPLCIRNYIFNNYNGQPGVTATSALNIAEVTGSITGAVPGATPIPFKITTFKNGPGDTIKGLELNFQHMFSNSGFGVSGNFTKVKTGLKFNNLRTDEQAALLGVSDSANLVGFFENDVWSVRGAYNWRGEFLAAVGDGNGNNPVYTEPYGQVDASIGYKVGKNLTLQVDLLNLNDGYIRQHGRTDEMLVSAIQTGRRYLIGARYRF